MKKLLTILFAVALAFNSNAQEVSATYDPDVDGDNNIGVDDLLSLLSLFGENDLDDDGIWDSQDDCVLDICGVCGGEGIDLDEDGICDDFDECVGEFDECGVCNGNGPEVLVIDTITFTTDSIFIEALNDWYVFEIPDTAFTFVCTNPGCIDPMAENFDPFASDDDGSCNYLDGGPACNYESSVTFDGYTYELISIGEQCWFAENLRTEHYANGDEVIHAASSGEFHDTNEGHQCISGEFGSLYQGSSGDVEQNLVDFGRLYNPAAVIDVRGICPIGFGVPNYEDFVELGNLWGDTISFQYGGPLGRFHFFGEVLKSNQADEVPWNGTNEIDFDWRPAGSLSGGFFVGTGSGNFLHSMLGLHVDGQVGFASVETSYSILDFTTTVNTSSLSVRCLKDAE